MGLEDAFSRQDAWLGRWEAWRMVGLKAGFHGRVHGLEDRIGELGGWVAWRMDFGAGRMALRMGGLGCLAGAECLVQAKCVCGFGSAGRPSDCSFAITRVCALGRYAWPITHH